jgi:tetratricopeptide (TPR) repeat protein
LEYADRVLALDPANVRASLVRSAALASKGRLSETRSLLNALLKLHSRLREAELQLALVNVEKKHYDDAEKLFRRNYIQGSGDMRALKGLVELYRARHQMDSAVALLQQDLQNEPQSFEVRALLAKTAAEDGKKELAVEEYELVARARPASVAIAMKLGQAYQAMPDPARAVAEFERARNLAPRNALAYSR